jgi:hypothetical protein
VFEVFFEALSLFRRTDFDEEGLQLAEELRDLSTWDELEDSELVELGGRVIEELGRRHRAGTANLVTEP